MINTKPGSMMRTCLVKRVTSDSRKAKMTPTSVPPRLTTKKDTAGRGRWLNCLKGPLWPGVAGPCVGAADRQSFQTIPHLGVAW